jgi:integrase
MALSDSWLRTNNGKPVEKEYAKPDRDGLSVRVSPKGRLTFQIRYSIDKKERKHSIGVYPSMSLKEAREKAAELKGGVKQGVDPSKALLKQRHTLTSRSDINSLWADFYEHDILKRVKNPEQRQRSFELYIKPKYGRVLAEDLTIRHWVQILKEVSKKRPSIADRLLTDIRKMYRYGVKFGDLTMNPLSELSAAYDLNVKKNETSRVLNEDELRLVIEAIKYTRNAPSMKTLARMCLLFACRVGELRLAEKKHFSGGLWTVPPENHKTGAKTKKPLIRPVIEGVQEEIDRQILLSQHKSLVFTRQDNVSPLVERSHLDLPYSLKTWIKRQHDIDIEHFSIHDFRRTARTFFSDFTEPHIAEIMLGHALPKVWRTYDLNFYIDKQRDAYQQWFDHLKTLGF